jgi:hypothetical protein
MPYVRLSLLAMISSNDDFRSLFLNEIKTISDKFDELFRKTEFDMRRNF